MATQVLIAHTGQRLEVDTTQFSTLDDLKAWVARNSKVPVQHIVALNPHGRSIKSTNLHAEKDIYIYDLRISQPASANNPNLIPEVPVPKKLVATNAPNSIDDVQSIASWQDLYQSRRNWAMRLAEDAARMNTSIQVRFDEMDTISKCLDAAVSNLENSIKTIEPKYTELKKWVEPALQDHGQLVTNWERYLGLAKATVVSPLMVRFMTRRDVGKSKPTLVDLVELETVKKAGKLAPTAHRRFSDKSAELQKAATKMYDGVTALVDDFNKLTSRSVFGRDGEAAQLLDDTEAVVKQMDSDYRTVLSYSNSQRDLAQASKTASVHTERLIPTLKKRLKEMDEMLQYATESRNAIAAGSGTIMRAITDVASLHSNVKAQINVLNQSVDDMTTFDYLRLIHQLPYMYASFTAEAIRRREWVDKVKTDSATLANEMALFQDEEAKRRRKWQKMVGSTYGPELETNVVGLEVNLHGEDNPWPAVTKDDLDDFLQVLQDNDVDQDILNDIVNLVHELNNPTKQQSKRLKAFKNGSVHEAALGRSGLMIRGDDELLRSLQDDKGKLESKLRTAESRVRRLEDLLHRQSQASHPGNIFLPQSPQPRERHDSGSSIRSYRADDRRRSSEGPDPLLRRITQLEHELREEKQRSTRIQQELGTQATQHDNLKGQFDEVNCTKNDLLGNMEALKREFVEERKSLENEIKTLKARLEYTEDEIDHFDESRQHEKATYVEKVEALEQQIEQLTKDRQDDALKAQGQVDFLRKETRTQREQQEALEQSLQTAQDEARRLSKELESAHESNSRQLETLESLYVRLAPGDSIPDDIVDLADTLISRATELVAKLQSADNDRALLKTDLDQALDSAKGTRTEIEEAQKKLSEQEMSTLHLQETLSEEKAKAAALEEELAHGREELTSLRAKLTDGEAGSENLQKRLEEEEKKITTLTEEVAIRQSRVGSLEEELHLFQEKVEGLQSKLTTLTHRHDARTERTKDLTQRLYTHTDRLTRLLERVGFSVTRKDGQMTIVKIPRSERVAQNPNDSSDPGSSIRRSVTLSRALADSTDLELLYWMDSTDEDLESEKYEAFMSKIGSFDMELFSDTIYRRVREVEHVARKWQKEARAYRDRAHTMQKDAHEKIAFKHFKEGDLALFLPTRNQQAGAWAAFNVGFPHYFLREQDSHRLRHREWLVARISRIQERVVDLSKSIQPSNETDSLNDDENDNPFQLSDGLRWYLIDAHEDKPGAPSTPGMGKSTVAANIVEATANIHTKGKGRDSIAGIEGIGKTLSKSLESRRSSSGSKKGTLPFNIGGGTALLKNSALASETNSLRAAPTDTPAATSPTHGGLLAAANASLAQKAQATLQGGPLDGKESEDQSKVQRRGSSGSARPNEPRIPAQREDSVESPTKKSVVWDSLWRVDYNYESGGRR